MPSRATRPRGTARLLRLVPLGLAACIAATACQPAMDGSQQTTASSSPIQLVWGYKPPTDGTTLSTLSTHYGAFVLTRDDEDYRDQLIAKGEHPPLMYVRFDAVLRPDSGKPPLKNNVADQPGEVEALLSAHPDWFLRNSAGNPIIDTDMAGYRAYIMDPANTGWQAYWISQVRAYYSAEGWQGGIFLDNVELSLKKRVRLGPTPVKYPTDDAYFGAVSSMLAAISTTWAGPAGVPVIPNAVESTTGDLAKPATLEMWTNGWLEEGFATAWRSDTWRSQREWEWQMDRVDQAVDAGDQAYLFSQGPKTDYARQRFALASYLMVSQTGQTFFRYVDYTAGYRSDWWYSNYTTALGTPKGNRYRVGATGWKRDFTKGSVTVDPTKRTAAITVT